jgi:hypothetical protein
MVVLNAVSAGKKRNHQNRRIDEIVNGVSVLGTGTLAGTLTLKTTPVWFN